jgi:hypothetical protein
MMMKYLRRLKRKATLTLIMVYLSLKSMRNSYYQALTIGIVPYSYYN